MKFRQAKIEGVGIDPSGYHGDSLDRGNPRRVMSSSALKLFRTCPRRWRDGYEPTDSTAKDWGTVVDCLILTPDQWGKRFAVCPETYPAPATHAGVKKGEISEGDPLPWNGNATICKQWLSSNSSKVIVKADEYGYAKKAAERFEQDSILKSFRDNSDTQVHVTATWTDKATGLEIPCRCLIDLVGRKGTEWQQCLGDLKTTRSAHPMAFVDFAYRYGYHIQAAWDLDMFNAATGEERDTWLFALQENYPPYQIGREMLSNRFIELGRIEYQHAMAKYAHCLATKTWPEYDDHPEALDGWTLMQPTLRMEQRTLEICAEAIHVEKETETEEVTEEENADLIL